MYSLSSSFPSPHYCTKQTWVFWQINGGVGQINAVHWKCEIQSINVLHVDLLLKINSIWIFKMASAFQTTKKTQRNTRGSRFSKDIFVWKKEKKKKHFLMIKICVYFTLSFCVCAHQITFISLKDLHRFNVNLFSCFDLISSGERARFSFLICFHLYFKCVFFAVVSLLFLSPLAFVIEYEIRAVFLFTSSTISVSCVWRSPRYMSWHLNTCIWKIHYKLHFEPLPRAFIWTTSWWRKMKDEKEMKKMGEESKNRRNKSWKEYRAIQSNNPNLTLYISIYLRAAFIYIYFSFFFLYMCVCYVFSEPIH